MPRPSHSSLFEHPNNIRRGVQFVKLFIVQSDERIVHKMLVDAHWINLAQNKDQ